MSFTNHSVRDAPTRRVRSATQLERKRARDRETQRIQREKHKARMSQIEEELVLLREQVAASCGGWGGRTTRLHSALPVSPPLCDMPLVDRASPGLEASKVSCSMFSARKEEVTSQLHGATTAFAALQSPSNSDVLSPAPQVCGGISTQNSILAASDGNVDFDLDRSTAYQLLGGVGLYQSTSVNHGGKIATFMASAPSPATASSPHDSVLSLMATDSVQPRRNSSNHDGSIFENESGHSQAGSEPETISPPTCMCSSTHIDGCLEKRAFKLLLDTHIAISENPLMVHHYPRTPSVANMLLIDVDSNPIVQVIGPLMQAQSPLHMAESIAVYYIMYRLLRWRIYPVSETYKDVPAWYRPSYLQKTRPHPLCIDLLAWPDLRDRLVADSFNYDHPGFANDIACGMSVEWPEDRTVLVKARGSHSIYLAPSFEAHIWDYSNWKMSRAWAEKYPRLAEFVNISDK